MGANLTLVKVTRFHINNLVLAHFTQPKTFCSLQNLKPLQIQVLVDVMLDLNKKIQTARGSRKDQIQRQIEKTDREIDELVVRLSSPNII